MPSKTEYTKEKIDKEWNRFLWSSYLYGHVKPVVDLLKGKTRDFHCFVIGTAKSGTHSLHGMFAEKFRSRHEPSFYLLNKLIIDAENNQLPQKTLERFYKYRDRTMRLEVESNYLNYYFIEQVVSLFPAAKFIILYREPRDWLDSWLNHMIERREVRGGIADEGLQAIYCPSRYEYDKREEEVLKKHQLHPLRCYLDHWLQCNRMLIENIPEEQILILETGSISKSAKLIAYFLGIDETDLAVRKSHLFKAKGKHYILDKLDPSYVNSLLAEYETHPAITRINNKITRPLRV